MMKKVISAAACMSIAVMAYAGEIRDVKSDISRVTVYREGAQVQRSLNISLPKGKTDVYVTGLSSKIDERSIQASAENQQVMIVSVNYSIDYMNRQSVSREVEELTARSKQIADSSAVITKLNWVYQQEKDMIIANRSIGGSADGVNMDELKTAAEFFRNRLSEIELLVHRNLQKTADMNMRQSAITRQLAALNAQLNKPTGVVKLTVSTDQAVRTGITVAYVVDDARWMPAYDIRIRDVDSPLDLFYKAQIRQNTDEDWNSVQLTLSTGNPSLNNTKPELQNYVLTFNNFYAPALTGGSAAGRGMLSGMVFEESGEPIPRASVVIKGTETGTVTDIDGGYFLRLPDNAHTVVFSSIGYETQELPITGSVISAKLIPEELMLEEVVVTGYGRLNSMDIAAEAPAAQAKAHIPVAIQQQQVSTEFAIDIPYSIPSDNQPYDVTMIEYSIPAGYQYSCVPKLSGDVFLMARIPDVTAYNLQNGEASLFFRGVYQGRTYIDARAMDDTLNISVGRDMDIVVERKLKRDYQSRRTVGSNIREQRAWDITVKNNKNMAVQVIVEDQYPVSAYSTIRVEDVLHTGAKANTDTGKLVWTLQLPPKASEQLGVSYTVRYPANRKVIVD